MTRNSYLMTTVLAVYVFTTACGASTAHANHFSGGEILYTSGVTTGPPTTYGTAPVELVSMSLTSVDPIGNVVPLPSPGETFTVDSFFDVFTEIRINGQTFDVDSFFDIKVTYRVTGSLSPGRWDTEMVSMDLSGSSPLPGGSSIQLRESPSLSSVGRIFVTDLPDGTFQVDSFFDVFTEMRLDDGAFFDSSDSSTRVVMGAQVPEPASAALLGLGGLALVRRTYGASR
jgi:PEP-CTERM motif